MPGLNQAVAVAGGARDDDTAEREHYELTGLVRDPDTHRAMQQEIAGQRSAGATPAISVPIRNPMALLECSTLSGTVGQASARAASCDHPR